MLANIKKLHKGERMSDGKTCPGLFARGLGAGRVGFFYQGRVKNSPDAAPKTRKIGEYPGTTLKQARESATKLRAEFLQGMDRRSAVKATQKATAGEKALNTITFREHWDWYFEAGLSRASAKTVKGYTQNINVVAPHIWDTPIRRVDTEAIRRIYRKPKNGSARGGQRFVVETRPVFKSATSREIGGSPLLNKYPADALGRIETTPQRRQAYLKAHEIHEAIGSFESIEEKLSLTEASAFVAAVFLALTGLRLNEVLNIRWDQVHLNGQEFDGDMLDVGFITVNILKKAGSFPWYIPITGPLLACLEHQAIIRQLLTEKGWDSVYLFPSMTRRHVRLYKIDEGLKLWRGAIPRPEFERDLKQQGIENTDVHKEISAHWLRHSFETIGVSQLGFGEGEVQRTFGKGVGSRRSQYTHDNVMSIVEQSLPVVLKIQAYVLDPSLQTRDQRRRLRTLTADDEKLLLRQTPWFWRTGPKNTTPKIRYEAEGWLYADVLSQHEDDPA